MLFRSLAEELVDRQAAHCGHLAMASPAAPMALFAAALVLALFMAGAWLVQRRTGQSGWVDTIWSFAVGLVGAAVALAPVAAADWPTARQGLVAALALAWSLRLGLHIVGRTLRGGEDPRYKALHDEWGADFPRRLFWFLQIQAAAAFLLAISIFAAARNLAPFPNIGDALGVGFWYSEKICISASKGVSPRNDLRSVERTRRVAKASGGRQCSSTLAHRWRPDGD